MILARAEIELHTTAACKATDDEELGTMVDALWDDLDDALAHLVEVTQAAANEHFPGQIEVRRE